MLIGDLTQPEDIAAETFSLLMETRGMIEERLCQLRGHEGGVTQVTFTRDGTKLLTGARKDGEIICWDLRQPGRVLYTMTRVVTTNQTVAFSLSPCSQFLVSANTDGSVRLWDLTGQADQHTGELQPLAGWILH